MSQFAEFNPNYRSPHVAPDCGNDGATDFPMEETIQRLDGDHGQGGEQIEEAGPSTDAARALSLLMEWVCAGRLREDERYLNVVGKRALAALWVSNPAHFGGVSARALAESLGISHENFSRLTSEFSCRFAIRNQFQKHDWRSQQ